MIITLEPYRKDWATSLARRQLANDAEAGLPGYSNLSHRTNLEQETMGIIGEWAFCKIHGIYFEACRDPKILINGKEDAKIVGYTVDVKTVDEWWRRMAINMAGFEDHPFDIYALMTWVGDTVTYNGYIMREDVIKVRKRGRKDGEKDPFWLVERKFLIREKIYEMPNLRERQQGVYA